LRKWRIPRKSSPAGSISFARRPAARFDRHRSDSPRSTGGEDFPRAIRRRHGGRASAIEEAAMTETSEEFRRQLQDNDANFYEQVNKRGEPHRARSFEYEKLAVEYSHRGLQLLTYLNGGALVAIPTALAFFKADVGKLDVLWTAGAFVAGLFFVVLAQVAAFFTMAKRAEASTFFFADQHSRIDALRYHHETKHYAERMAAAQTDYATGRRRIFLSDIWRLIGLFFFGLSLIAFVSGCGWGALVVMLAKEVAAK
jgi:hypothetical protein